MQLDDTRFPLVILRPHDNDVSSMEEQIERNRQLEALLDRQTPFVLIADHASHDHDDETPEERKAKALFFKQIKQRMQRYCIGMIVIEGSDRMNAAARLAAAGAGKALGFSIEFAPDEQSALNQGMGLLARNDLGLTAAGFSDQLN